MRRDPAQPDVPVRGFWSYYAELMGIEQRHVLADETAGLERPHTGQARRGREVHPLGQLHVGQARIGLQLSQDSKIGRIKFHHAVHFRRFGILCCQIGILQSSSDATAASRALKSIGCCVARTAVPAPFIPEGIFKMINPSNSESGISADPDPSETDEWRQAFDSVLETQGAMRAQQILEALSERARLRRTHQ